MCDEAFYTPEASCVASLRHRFTPDALRVRVALTCRSVDGPCLTDDPSFASGACWARLDAPRVLAQTSQGKGGWTQSLHKHFARALGRNACRSALGRERDFIRDALGVDVALRIGMGKHFNGFDATKQNSV